MFRCVLAWYELEGVLSYGLRGLLLAGTIMVTYGDAKQGNSSQLNTVGGDLLVLLSGLCYAAYTVEQHHLFNI